MTPRIRPFAGLVLLSVLALATTNAQAQSREFQRAYTGNLPGQLVVNGDASTFNSSSANLGLGGQIEWAGLYWWGSLDPNGVSMTFPTQGQGSVLMKAPGVTYASVVASWVVPGDPYIAFANVTSLVRAGGMGTYQVANVAAYPGQDDHLGGWSLVVVNRDSTLPFRHISIYDGYREYGNGNAVSIPLQDFLTPLHGEVKAQTTFIALDGDAGKADEVAFNGNRLSNTLNPAGDFGNSTITRGGAAVTARNPSFGNTLGTDIDTFEVGSMLNNGAVNATATFAGASGETNFAALLGFQTTLYSPDIRAEKQALDLNGAPTRPGDILEYAVTIRNTETSLDGAIRVVMSDAIPANTTYVRESMTVVRTTTGAAPIGRLSDTVDTDVAAFDSGGNRIVVNLGSFATSNVGGTMGPGDTIEIRFRVTVDGAIDQTATVSNQASISFEGLTLSNTSSSALIVVNSTSPEGGPTNTMIVPVDTD